MKFVCESCLPDNEVRVVFYGPSRARKYLDALKDRYKFFQPEIVEDDNQLKTEIDAATGSKIIMSGPILYFKIPMLDILLCAACGTSAKDPWTNRPDKIIVYTMPTCPYCLMVVQEFIKIAVANGIDIEMRDLEESEYTAAPTLELYWGERKEVVVGANIVRLKMLVGWSEEN